MAICTIVSADYKSLNLGRFEKDLNDGKSLRGSSNQNIIQLTDRYKPYVHLYGVKGRQIEIHSDEFGNCKFFGVPPLNIREIIMLQEE